MTLVPSANNSTRGSNLAERIYASREYSSSICHKNECYLSTSFSWTLQVKCPPETVFPPWFNETRVTLPRSPRLFRLQISDPRSIAYNNPRPAMLAEAKAIARSKVVDRFAKQDVAEAKARAARHAAQQEADFLTLHDQV